MGRKKRSGKATRKAKGEKKKDKTEAVQPVEKAEVATAGPPVEEPSPPPEDQEDERLPSSDGEEDSQGPDDGRY